MKIIWTRLALERVKKIANYIAYDKPKAAKRWIETVFKKVEILIKFPEMGRKVPESNNSSVRELIFGNYRIIYRCDKTKIYILTVRCSQQILPLNETY